MIRAFWLVVAPWSWCIFKFGGSSSSTSSTSTTYSVRDERIAAGEGSTVDVTKAGADLLQGDALKVTGTGNQVQTLDDDVVRLAFDYGQARDALAGETFDNVLTASRDIYARASDALQVASSAPRGQLTERTISILIAGGLAVAGLLAFRGRKT